MPKTAPISPRLPLIGLWIGLALCISSCGTPSQRLKPHISPIQELAAASASPEGSSRDQAIARALTKISANPERAPAGLAIRWHGRDGYEALDFDNFVAASSVTRRGWKYDWHQLPGAGTPLVLARDQNEKRFVGKRGSTMPATATLATTAAGYQITLHDSLVPGSEKDHLGVQSIARDYTAPVAQLLRGNELMPGLKAVFSTDKYIDQLGLKRTSPFDPNKTPVILVHGLKSNPEVWVDLVNDLGADDTIRANYQFWFYAYPTGAPILYTAMRLRTELESLREHYDPKAENPNLDRMVIVGHSMGGIVSRLLVSSSNKKLLERTVAPLEELNLSPKAKELARRTLVFEPLPFIDRAIFLAAPHRGSDVAHKPIVQWISSLIRLPGDLTRTMLTMLTLRDESDPTDAKGSKFPLPNGLSDLDPDSYFMEAMGDQPVSKNVPFHSIIAIGKKGAGMPLEDTDDSLVRYPSAHLDGAKSEITIAASHNIYDHPDAIREVTRILKLNLKGQ